MRIAHDPVVFDLDGTLIDSGPTIVRALQQACTSAGATLRDGTDLTVCVGPPLEISLPRLLRAEDDLEAVLRIYREIYPSMAERATLAMPGAVELLKELRTAEVKLAIATYKPVDLAVRLLDSTGLREFFDVCGGRVSVDDRRTKTQILAGVLERLAPHRERPLFVGDHEEDRCAALALSVDFIRYDGDASWDAVRRTFLDIRGR